MSAYARRLNDFIKVYNDRNTYPTILDVARAVDLSVSRVKSKASEVRALNRAGRDDIDHIIYRDRVEAQMSEPNLHGVQIEQQPEAGESVEDLIERAITYNESLAHQAEAKKLVNVQLQERGWFGVTGLPDQHLNNPGTDLRRAFDDARLIAETEGVYAISIGDTLDNFIIGRLERERRKDIMSHEQAWMLQEHYYEILSEKLLIAIGGNHNDWIKMLGGMDILRRQMKELGLDPIYHPVQQRVRLRTAGSHDFTHFARHGYPGHSKYHATHGILVWALERWQGEDVFWGGHVHTSGYMQLQKEWMGRRRVVQLVQMSAYKKLDDYAVAGGFRENDTFTTPIVLHNAGTGETMFFDDVRRGVSMLKHLRETEAA